MNVQYSDTVPETDIDVLVVVGVEAARVTIINANDQAGASYIVEFDQVCDVVQLATIFAHERVCVFAVIVRLLGRVAHARGLFDVS